MGGTPEGNGESSLEAIPKVLSFLQQSLPGRPPGEKRCFGEVLVPFRRV